MFAIKKCLTYSDFYLLVSNKEDEENSADFNLVWISTLSISSFLFRTKKCGLSSRFRRPFYPLAPKPIFVFLQKRFSYSSFRLCFFCKHTIFFFDVAVFLPNKTFIFIVVRLGCCLASHSLDILGSTKLTFCIRIQVFIFLISLNSVMYLFLFSFKVNLM